MEGYPGDRPATLVHGVFDDVPLVCTELANVPNWLPLILFVDGERFRMDRGTVSAYRREPDLRTGILTRTVRWRSPIGHAVDLAIERFASLANRHVLGIRYRVTTLDFAGTPEFRAGVHPPRLRKGLDKIDFLSIILLYYTVPSGQGQQLSSRVSNDRH